MFRDSNACNQWSWGDRFITGQNAGPFIKPIIINIIIIIILIGVFISIYPNQLAVGLKALKPAVNGCNLRGDWAVKNKNFVF